VLGAKPRQRVKTQRPLDGNVRQLNCAIGRWVEPVQKSMIKRSDDGSGGSLSGTVSGHVTSRWWVQLIMTGHRRAAPQAATMNYSAAPWMRPSFFAGSDRNEDASADDDELRRLPRSPLGSLDVCLLTRPVYGGIILSWKSGEVSSSSSSSSCRGNVAVSTVLHHPD